MGELKALDLIFRLVLSAIFAGCIGLERESHGRPAGLRTHILVSVGSCLVMLISIYGFGEASARDPARLAAQVISGIGFLGAGTILREGATVKGLTTAASLWVVAGIGLAVGSGFYLGAICTTALAVAALFFLEKVEKRFISPRGHALTATILDQPGGLGALCTAIGRYGFSIRQLEMDRSEAGTVDLVMQIEGRGNYRPDEILEELRALPGVRRIALR